jgi:hypothetical protein
VSGIAIFKPTSTSTTARDMVVDVLRLAARDRRQQNLPSLQQQVVRYRLLTPQQSVEQKSCP